MQVTSTREEIKFRGHIEEPKIVQVDETLSIIRNLLDKEIPFPQKEPRESLKAALESSRLFYDSKFTLHEVPFINETKIGPLKIERTGTIHPFGLPIKKERKVDPMFGVTNECLSFEETGTTLSYRSIYLTNRPTVTTKLAYSHELAHTQLNHVPELTKNYTNSEVISIFIELLHAYEGAQNEELLRLHDIRRLSELITIIDEMDKLNKKGITPNTIDDDNAIEASTYIHSTLKAYNLFMKYYYGDIYTRKCILTSIQKLFNHERSVEETLIDYDITFKNSQDIEKIKKYINR